jgi:pimeloyl-ACP methyl ester carboxylesterase
MPILERGDASIYYEEYGDGFPVLLFAAGSLQSTIDAWHRGRWDPTKELVPEFHVIAMDQRNAGRSRAPIRATDGWKTFLEDHIALLDHLKIERAHVMGACIGVSFILQLVEAQPERVVAAVCQQPIGANQPRETYAGFDRWAESLTDHPEATPEVLAAYKNNIYGPGFVLSVSRDFVRGCQTPLLILPGNDDSHPLEIAQELAQLAPNAEYIAEWRDEAADAAYRRVHEFLREHTSVSTR